jgi:hypothetical protein
VFVATKKVGHLIFPLSSFPNPNQDPGVRMNITDITCENLVYVFWVKNTSILRYGSGMRKIGSGISNTQPGTPATKNHQHYVKHMVANLRVSKFR